MKAICDDDDGGGDGNDYENHNLQERIFNEWEIMKCQTYGFVVNLRPFENA